MKRISVGPLAATLTITWIMAGCGERAAAPEAGQVADSGAKMHQLFADHFEAVLQLNPLLATSIGDDRFNDRLAISIAPDHIAKSKEVDSDFLERLLAIDPNTLSAADRLSYDMFRLNREASLEGYRFPGHLQPMNQFRSMTSRFVQLGSGSGLHPFNTVKDYDDFLSRIDDFVVYVDQAIENMQLGVAQGITQPRILMAKLLPQIDSQIVDAADQSGFYAPVTAMPDDFSDADKERLTAAYVEAIEKRIVPAFQRLSNYIGDDYMTAARDSVGMLGLPGGDEWYDYNVRRMTTTDLTPDEIHQIGLDEVARIHSEMRGVMDAIGFDGDLSDFFDYVSSEPSFFYNDPEDLIQGYRDITAEVEAAAPKLFKLFPKTAFEVRRVEPFREKSASRGSYQSGTTDGSRPGIFYANAYNVSVRPKWNMKSLFLHEAIPGHHFQISLQQESEDLPDFRRFGGYTAYVEGWGLYSERLGKELGVYEDPMDYYGSLHDELWRSIRLVVDTGLHAKGWSRQQVLDYMFANASVSQTRAVQEAERFMAIPGQALAYKIGQLKILEIRADAEERLGGNFDVREFHAQILNDGPMPLSMLESKIDNWVQAKL